MKVILRIVSYLPILLFGFADCDNECYEMRNENVKHLEFKIIETDFDASIFEVLRTPIIKRTGKDIRLNDYFDDLYLHDITFDKSGLIFDRGTGLYVLDFSSINHFHPFFSDTSIKGLIDPFNFSDDIDFSLASIGLLANPDYETNPHLPFSNTEYYLASLDNSFEIADTIFVSRDEFLESDLYVARKIEDPSYDLSTGTAIFKLSEDYYSYDTTSTQNSYYGNLIESKYHLLSQNPDLSVDTLINSSSLDFSYIITENYFFLTTNNETHIHTKDGNYLKSVNYGPVTPSQSGLTFITESGDQFVYTRTEESIDISIHNKNGTYYATNDEYLLIVQENKYIDIIQIPDNELVGSITTNKIPGLTLSVDKRSTLKMFFPVFTSNGKIRFLFADSYYIDDPYDDCEI